MEKKIYFGVVSKATQATMVQTRVNNGLKKEVEVKGLQVSFRSFSNENGNEIKAIPTTDKEGNDGETASIFIPFCKIEPLFVWGVMLDFVRIILPTSENEELQRVLAISLINQTIKIESIGYDKGEYLANENKMYVRNYEASISLEKFEPIALKLQERADQRVKEEKAKEEEVKAAKSAAQTAAVFGAV